jgi:Tfp pilus assembly protein PilF
MWFQFSVAGMLVALVWLAHGGAVNGGFHYDDFHAIVDNPVVRTWDPVQYFLRFFRPVTVTSFALNVLWDDMRPGGFLLINLILHTLNSWLVYLIGRRLLGSDRWATVAAVTYAVHPVNAEAVNYVVTRFSVLSSFFAFVACWALLRRDEGMRGALGLAVAAFGLALLSKEAAIALLPPVVVKGWLNRNDRSASDSFVTDAAATSRKWDLPVMFSFIGVSVGFVILFRFMHSGVPLATPEDAYAEGAAAYPAWAFLEIIVKGLLLWVWPSPLGLDHPIVFAGRFDGVLATMCLAVIGSLVVLAFWSRRRAPFVAWVLVWIGAAFGPLLPLPWLTTRGLFQENRLSFAAAGLAWLTAWGCRAAGPRLAVLVRNRTTIRVILGGLGGALLLAAVVVDRGRSEIWRDDVRLWEEVVSRRGDDYLAWSNLGLVYRKRRILDASTSALERAKVVEPNALSVALNLGQAYQRQGRGEEAERIFIDALARWDPAARRTHHAGVRHPSGDVMWGDPKDAQAIRITLGEVYLARQDFARAQVAYEDATRADVSDFRAWYNLGVVAERRGNVETARDAYQRAKALAPHESRVVSAVERLTADSP